MADDRRTTRDDDANGTNGSGRDQQPDQTRRFDPSAGEEPGTRAGEVPAPVPPRAPVWSGRAGVPPPRPAANVGRAADWDDYYEQPGRPWWTPILVGLVALVLLGVLAFGVWLIVQSRNGDTGPGVPSVSTSASAPSTRPSSVAPSATGAAPSATAAPDTPAAPTVPMPALRGLSREEATDLLDRLGIDHRFRFRSSDQPAGTVLETDPAAGEPVAAGQRVTLVLARPSDPTPDPIDPTASTNAGMARSP